MSYTNILLKIKRCDFFSERTPLILSSPTGLVPSNFLPLCHKPLAGSKQPLRLQKRSQG